MDNIDKVFDDCIGVYAIVNRVSGKYYIGSTSEALKHRRWHHIKELNKNKHGNQHLQRSWNKHGRDAFIFVVLDVCADKAECLRIEQEYIDIRLAIDPENTYNICQTAHSRKGTICSPETRAKMAKTWNITLISPDGEMYKDIHNLLQFCRDHKLEYRNVQQMVRRLRRKHRGWTVPLEDQNPVKQYRLLSPAGELVVCGSLTELARKLGLSPKRFGRITSARKPSYEGWRQAS